jgi:lysine-N-methylase
MVLGMLEQTLTMSCPEAARLALLNPKKMSYAEIPLTTRITFQLGKNIVAKDPNRIEYYFANLRLFTIELLQNRDYSISDRLIVVGLAMRKVQECVDSERLTDIPRVLNSYAEAVNSGTLKASLQAIPSNLTIQIKLMKAIADRRLIQGVASLRYRECYAEFLKGLNFTPEATDEEIANQYRQAYENYFEPFLKEHEYIFENYLVNSALRETFPLTDTLSVYESYISLVLPFAWMKLVLVGMAGYQRSQFGVESVLKLIQSYTKVVEHNAQFKKEVINILKQEGYDSMPYMSILLRN